MSRVEMLGKRFGRWTVIAPTEKTDKNGSLKWLCECKCGTCREVSGSSLRRGKSLSCGCYHSERVIETHTTHGAASSKNRERLYAVWNDIMYRCYNPKADSYPHYGGRGITVCDEWKDYSVFREWAVKAGYDPNAPKYECMIDRIDGNAGYTPGNCRWANIRTQNNNRRTCHYILWTGETHTVTEWNRILGFPPGLLIQRIRCGWDMDRAATEPVRITKQSRR